MYLVLVGAATTRACHEQKRINSKDLFNRVSNLEKRKKKNKEEKLEERERMDLLIPVSYDLFHIQTP